METITAPTTQPHLSILTTARVIPWGTEGTVYITRNGQYLDKNTLTWTSRFSLNCLFPSWPSLMDALAQIS